MVNTYRAMTFHERPSLSGPVFVGGTCMNNLPYSAAEDRPVIRLIETMTGTTFIAEHPLRCSENATRALAGG
ncbi:MAG TPA: hypothetical protein DEW10_06430 [Bifidobacterium sp.]|nr:hypothetical protein [Bifidobacterium sp.]HAK71145.1 hypothetical protein [Bifidobacterium sp.]HCA74725.1 hypothetical protein [Bifidobacterium sp.]HCH22342.1 hypothetical protein [Bifidobacterium sp.]